MKKTIFLEKGTISYLDTTDFYWNKISFLTSVFGIRSMEICSWSSSKNLQDFQHCCYRKSERLI